MKNSHEIESRPHEGYLFGPSISFKVKPVIRVEVNNPDEVHIIYEEKKLDRFVHDRTFCGDDIPTARKKEFMQAEAQIWYEVFKEIKKLRDSGKYIDAIAVYIDIAKRAKALALNFSYLYKSEENKQLAINLVYDLYVMMNYGRAITCLKELISSDESNDKNKLGKWLIYAHGQLLAASVVTKNVEWIEDAKKEGKSIDEFLIANSLGHLVDSSDRYPSETIKHNTSLLQFTNPLQSLRSFFRIGETSQQSVDAVKSSDNKDRPHTE